MNDFYKRIKLGHKLKFYKLIFESLLFIGTNILIIGLIYNLWE